MTDPISPIASVRRLLETKGRSKERSSRFTCETKARKTRDEANRVIRDPSRGSTMRWEQRKREKRWRRNEDRRELVSWRIENPRPGNACSFERRPELAFSSLLRDKNGEREGGEPETPKEPRGGKVWVTRGDTLLKFAPRYLSFQGEEEGWRVRTILRFNRTFLPSNERGRSKRRRRMVDSRCP